MNTFTDTMRSIKVSLEAAAQAFPDDANAQMEHAIKACQEAGIDPNATVNGGGGRSVRA